MSLKLVKKFINIESMFPDSGCRKAILLRYSAYQLAGAFMELEFFYVQPGKYRGSVGWPAPN